MSWSVILVNAWVLGSGIVTLVVEYDGRGANDSVKAAASLVQPEDKIGIA